MDCDKNCYFCRYLRFLDVGNATEFFCTLKGLTFQKANLLAECEDYTLDQEE